MKAVTRDELLEWFEADELMVCPSCGKPHALDFRETGGTIICFGCGFVSWAGGNTTIAAIQGR